jgi:hypothetical protein
MGQARRASALSTEVVPLTAGFSNSSSTTMESMSSRSALAGLIAPAIGPSRGGPRPVGDDGSMAFVSNDARRPISSSLRQIELASGLEATGADPAAIDLLFGEWKDLVELLP